MQMGVSITKWKHEVDVLVDIKDGKAFVHGRYSAANSMNIFQQPQQTLF